MTKIKIITYETRDGKTSLVKDETGNVSGLVSYNKFKSEFNKILKDYPFPHTMIYELYSKVFYKTYTLDLGVEKMLLDGKSLSCNNNSWAIVFHEKSSHKTPNMK